MYNLLVTSEPNYWSKYDHFKLGYDRFCEYTEEGIKSHFEADLNKLTELPCLFAYEGLNNNGSVGHIRSISKYHNNLEIEYFLDPELLKIPMDSEENLSQLGYELNRSYFNENERSHWAIKNIDLFKIISKIFSRMCKQEYLRLNDNEMMDVWGQYYKSKNLVFLSHRATSQREVAWLGDWLNKNNIGTFIAPRDIHPTSEWKDEIIKALNTMTYFIGIVTDDFHKGSWTDQEIGYALKSNIPRLFVKIGKSDPQGFVNSEQALSTTWNDAPLEIISHLDKTCNHLMYSS